MKISHDGGWTTLSGGQVGVHDSTIKRDKSNRCYSQKKKL